MIHDFYKILGIIDIKSRTILGEDKNIPFSRYDSIQITTTKYISGEVKIDTKYNRVISNTYNHLYKILSNTFGYEIYDGEFKTKYGYYFHRDGFPRINIEINNFHPNLFKISIGYKYYDTFYEIDKFEDIVFKKLKKSSEHKIKRYLTLKQLNMLI